MKIKKYTIDEEIPKGAVPVFTCTNNRPHDKYEEEWGFYFLVEEESKRDMSDVQPVYRQQLCDCKNTLR